MGLWDDVVAPVAMVPETSDSRLVAIECHKKADYGNDVNAELAGETGSIATYIFAFTRTDKAQA